MVLRRILFLATFLSLSLCAASAALWLLPFQNPVGPIQLGAPAKTTYALSAYRTYHDPDAHLFHYTGYISISTYHDFSPETPQNKNLWHFTSTQILPGI